MSDAESLLQPCPNCATLLDVSEEDPFAQVHCPICGTAMRVRKQFNNFSIEEALGAGGMGAVYRATDLNLNRQVALKLLRKEYSADSGYIAKFETEARITASINHPHVVKVFSFGSDHGIFYIAMELVDKGSLDDLINLQQRVAEIQVLDVGIQIAQGLQAAFQRELIHRDVKPGNILFADAHTAKIVDFGLALLMAQEAEARGEVWGTPYYVAPEKLNNEPEDFRSDIYSLGGTLFHALAGRPPFEAETASMVALKHIKSHAVSLQAFAPDISSATAYVVNRMLHKNPDERYPSYTELIEHLNYAKAQLVESMNKPRQPKARVVVESEGQQQLMSWIVFAMIGILVAAGILVYVFRDRVWKKDEVDTTPPPAHAAKTPSQSMGKYEDARKQIIDGDFSAAEEVFRKIGEQQDVPQPLLNWAALHEGMCALLTGHLSEGRGIFKRIQQAGMFSTEPGQVELANFFVEAGRLMSGSKPLPGSAAKNYNGSNFEALDLFLFALKDWESSDFDSAGDFLQKYLSAEPAAPYAWIAEYKPIAQKYADDFSVYKKVADRVQTVSTPEEEQALLKDLKTAEDSIQIRGRLNEKLLALQREVQQKISAAEEAIKAKHDEISAEEKQRQQDILAAAETKFDAACAAFRFSDAENALKEPQITVPEVAAKRDGLLKKAVWLEKFKSTLLADINAVPYPSGISKRTGPALAGALKDATADGAQMQIPYGQLPVTWIEITPASILSIANFYIKTPAAQVPQAERQWLAGVYALQAGMGKEGKDLVTAASQANNEYIDQLPIVLGPNTIAPGAER